MTHIGWCGHIYAKGRRHVRRYKFDLKNIAATAGKNYVAIRHTI